MQTQVRPPRQRSSGGRTLMLLGLVLALAAAGLVLYVTSSVQGVFVQTASVVVAKQNLKAGTVLTVGNSQPQANSMLISDAFAVQQVDKKIVPADAYVFTNQDALNTVLVNKVVKEDFLAGDVLRANDPRLALIGTTNGNSISNINPPAYANGQVLIELTQDNGGLGLQPGDTIDIIATGAAKNGNGPNSQYIIGNIPVYAVDVPVKGKIWVVLSEHDALELTSWEQAGRTLTIVIRKPGDTSNPTQTTPPVTVTP